MNYVPILYLQYSRCNITMMSLVPRDSPRAKTLLNELQERFRDHGLKVPPESLDTESAVVYDSVFLMAQAIKDANNMQV